jgi:NADPH2:quinone reductase
MKAMLCKAFGPPESLVLEELPSKPLPVGQVRILVHAAGVNFPDVLMIAGKYQFKPPFPFAPGSEVAGEVIETAPDVATPKRGDRVMAMVGAGGFADELVAPAGACMVLPASMDYVTAAGFSMTYGTSYYALVQRAAIQPGEFLLVHGAAGGVGTAALDIGRNLGAKLIATGGDDKKLERVAAQYGVEHVINYRNEPNWKDKVKALTMSQGADVIYDAVGGEILENSLRCVSWNGRVLVIGFASGEIPKVPANLVLLKNASLVGVFWGAWLARDPAVNRKNFATMFAWHEANKLKPIVSHTFPLAQAKDALYALIHREVVGKCVITTDHSTSTRTEGST